MLYSSQRVINHYHLYELDHDPFSMSVVILTYKKFGKVLVVVDFNARVGTKQNGKVYDNVMWPIR